MTDAQRSRRRQVSRRSFLQGIGIGSTTLLLAACPAPAPADSGGEGGSAPAAEDIELDFFAWGDASDIPAWEELGNTYTEQNPNVTIKPSISGTGVDYYTKLQTTFAGGVVPEVASFQGWEWQPFSDAGLLAPIDAYVERDNFTGPYPDGVDSIEFSTRRDGSRYLIPLQSGVMVMFYAKNAFDEAGVAYPTDDWTFEDFVSIAEQLTSTDGDSKMYGYQANGSYARDIHWIRATGVQEFDELVDPRTAMYDQPEIIEILQFVAQDFMYGLGISPTPADLEGGTNTIDTGNAAMKYEGPWFFPRLNSPELREEGKEIEFDVVLMPQMADESRLTAAGPRACAYLRAIWWMPPGTSFTTWAAKMARRFIRPSLGVSPTPRTLSRTSGARRLRSASVSPTQPPSATPSCVPRWTLSAASLAGKSGAKWRSRLPGIRCWPTAQPLLTSFPRSMKACRACSMPTGPGRDKKATLYKGGGELYRRPLEDHSWPQQLP